jgi:quinol-cytochrome oxidoreductase complex cytochrome b subunit
VATNSGTSAIVPFSNIPPSTPFSALRAVPALIVAVILLFLVALGVKRHLNAPTRRFTFSGAFAATVVGCGGGSTSLASPQPPQIVTPQGQFIIIVTPSAMSANGKPLQLQPIQLALIVN